jgi:F-type H+-transporting ATPase subunit epsilon
VNTFTLHLHSLTTAEVVSGVRSLVARDASGSFGIQAGHEHFMTTLEFGLARYCIEDDWEYLALPGGILRTTGKEVWLFTRRYLRDRDYRRLGDVLERQLRTEEEALRTTRTSLRQMEQNLLRRLWELERLGQPL